MPRRFIRLLLVLVIMLSSEVWALGLGEVRLDSALNEPLRAKIELLGATPEELENLNVALASADTFERYGIDRPFYLQDMVFDIVPSGQADGNYISVRSTSAITEPFLTFLVEATWSRGRLLREYTVLLDPPTFAPPSIAQPQPAVTAPQRSTATDSGRIERESAPQPAQPRPAPAPVRPAEPVRTSPVPQEAAPKPQAVADDTPYETADGGDYVVQRGETLWGIASAMRPDSRLSMNQTMLAIFEANPQAFQGNINVLSAGSSLRMPSADEIYGIDRRDALSEVQRQHSAWGGYAPPPPTTSQPVADAETRQTVRLVPADEEPVGVDTGIDTGFGDEPMTREQEVLDRIAELDAADVPIQQSLIEIRNNELAALRAELADIRGEPYEPLIEDVPGSDDLAVDDEIVDDMLADETVDAAGVDEVTELDEEPVVEETAEPVSQGPASILREDPSSQSIIDQALGWLTSIWAFIAYAVIVVVGILFWFVRRGREDDDDSGVWTELDADEQRIDPLDSTESIQAPRLDESIVVVEQDSIISALDDDTVEASMPEPVADINDETTQFGSLEDTFSSETAINLDQSDPIAEADFHMAYGLYDQAADLIDGALQIEPDREDLLTKLCEIYFVWGNRDSFVDAAQRLNGVVGGGESADWDKIVIMGQQIAADHELFAGAGVAGATKAIDLSFEADSGGTGALDMEFGGDDGSDDVIDLSAFDDDPTELADTSATAATGVDFNVTAEMPTIEASINDDTAALPTTESTVETPTIEQQFEGFGDTSALPSIDENELGGESDATAEIDLDDLDLGIDGLAETELASLDDLDVTGTNEALADTGLHSALGDSADATGRNPQIDPDATGVQIGLDPDASGMSEAVMIDDELSSTSTGMRLAPDETGQNPMVESTDASSIDLDVDPSLLDATGHTQILSEDLAVATASEEAGILSDSDATMLAPGYGDDDTVEGLGDDQETVLASLDDEDDFDFAKTEALPPEVFTGSSNLDETGELPALASTDVDMDLDDLTAALKVSELGDTVEQARDDATVEQPKPHMRADETGETIALEPADMSDDLQEARTMTEVGTKLDLARAYVDMGDPAGARGILLEVLDEGDESQRQHAQTLIDSLPS